MRKAHIAGFLFGYSNCARMLFIGIVFYFGSWLVKRDSDKADMIYLAIMIIFSTCMGSGVAMSNVPSVQKAKNSAGNIFSVIDDLSTLDVRKDEKAKDKVGEIARG